MNFFISCPNKFKLKKIRPALFQEKNISKKGNRLIALKWAPFIEEKTLFLILHNNMAYIDMRLGAWALLRTFDTSFIENVYYLTHQHGRPNSSAATILFSFHLLLH